MRPNDVRQRGEGKPETFNFLGLHALLRDDAEGNLHDQT